MNNDYMHQGIQQRKRMNGCQRIQQRKRMNGCQRIEQCKRMNGCKYKLGSDFI